MSAPRQPIRIERIVGSHSYAAFVGPTMIGKASAWMDSREVFSIMDVCIRADFRRRGVATALYREIEANSGKELKPALSLSDEAFEFWKSFRPEAVASDLRQRRAELIGQNVVDRNRPATIFSVSGGVATARYDDVAKGSSDSEVCIFACDLDQALAAGRARQMELAATAAALHSSQADLPLRRSHAAPAA